RAAIEPMRDRVRVAIDDAGAGFASLRHVVELTPAFVKLDRSFIVGIAGDRARLAMVAGMVKFTQSLGIGLVAEGIEEEAELAALRSLGVDYGQGYLLGRPAIVAQAPVALRKGAPSRAISMVRSRASGQRAAMPRGVAS
ncbi:MAG: EAL domain-containing protein, partial [Chloroflexota bacterium]